MQAFHIRVTQFHLLFFVINLLPKLSRMCFLKSRQNKKITLKKQNKTKQTHYRDHPVLSHLISIKKKYFRDNAVYDIGVHVFLYIFIHIFRQ